MVDETIMLGKTRGTYITLLTVLTSPVLSIDFISTRKSIHPSIRSDKESRVLKKEIRHFIFSLYNIKL